MITPPFKTKGCTTPSSVRLARFPQSIISRPEYSTGLLILEGPIQLSWQGRDVASRAALAISFLTRNNPTLPTKTIGESHRDALRWMDWFLPPTARRRAF